MSQIKVKIVNKKVTGFIRVLNGYKVVVVIIIIIIIIKQPFKNNPRRVLKRQHRKPHRITANALYSDDAVA